MKEITNAHLRRNPIGMIAWDYKTKMWDLNVIAKFQRLQDLFVHPSMISELQYHPEFEAFKNTHPSFRRAHQRYVEDMEEFIKKNPQQYVLNDIRRRGVEAWLREPSNVHPSILAQWTNIEKADTSLAFIEEWHHAITKQCTPEQYAKVMLPIFEYYTDSKQRSVRPHFGQHWYKNVSYPHRKAIEDIFVQDLQNTQNEEYRYNFVHQTLREGWMLPFDPKNIEKLTKHVHEHDAPHLEYMFDDDYKIRINETWWPHTKLYKDKNNKDAWLKIIKNNNEAISSSDERALNDVLTTFEQQSPQGMYTRLLKIASNIEWYPEKKQHERIRQLLNDPQADNALDYISINRWPTHSTQIFKRAYLSPDRCFRLLDDICMNPRKMISDNLLILIAEGDVMKSLLLNPKIHTLRDMVILGLLYYALPMDQGIELEKNIDKALGLFDSIQAIHEINPTIKPSEFLSDYVQLCVNNTLDAYAF